MSLSSPSRVSVAEKKRPVKRATAKVPVAAPSSDDGEWEENGAQAAEPEEDREAEVFVLSDGDEDDAPAQQVATAGATADPVKDYLKQIGKVPLLNAEQEVELAKRIEAGL
ncbi:sigma-70 factor domain-containing protein, partial [Kitasatospora sp. NPDC004289]